MFGFGNGSRRHWWAFLWVIPVVAALLVFVAAPWEQEYTECLIDQSAKNQVKLVFATPGGNLESVGNRIDGYVYWAEKSLTPPVPSGRARLYFEVPLEQIGTGVKTTDRALHESCLESAWFPYLRYDGVITQVEPEVNGGMILTVDGVLHLHGASRRLKIQHVIQREGKCYRLTSDFELDLRNYGIETNRLQLLQAEEVVRVLLDFRIREVRAKGV